VKLRSVLALAALLAACDPTTRRPTFLPRPEAATTELELAVPAATRALAEALQADSVPLARVAPRDGFIETAWLDAATMKPATLRPVGPSVVRLRGWVDPSRYGYSRLTVEVVYRAIVDPSLPVRETEAAVPYTNPARARVRTVLGKLGGTPVDQPEVVVAHAPAPKPDTAGTPAPSPIPSPVSVDSGALLRGKRDSITSTAPTAAPNQGQRAAPAPRPVPPARADTARPRMQVDTTARPARVDTTHRPVPADTTRRPSRADTTRHVPQADTATRRARPDTTRPVPSTTTRRAARYSVQVAAARRRAEVDPVVASLVANGFAARIVSSGGWERVWVGDYASAAAADSARRVIRARQGGSPFVVRQ
jgi:cell division protein FtsN